MPLIVTVLLVPIALFANEAVAPLVSRVMVSLLWMPTSAAEPLLSNAVADVVASYTRLLAVMPLTVSSF